MYIGFLLLLSLPFISSQSVAAQTIAPLDAVQLIERFEKKVAFVEYDMKTFNTFAAETNQKWSIMTPQFPSFKKKEIGVYSATASVAVNPSEQWFLYSSRTVFKSVFKADASKGDIYTFNVHNSQYSCDGELFQCQVIGDRFSSPPTKLDEHGNAIWVGAAGMRVENYGFYSTWESHSDYVGDKSNEALASFRFLGCMAWTDFETTVLLSKFLRRKISAGESIMVRQKSNGTLEIFCPVHKSHTHQYSVKFYYDVGLGRINRIEWGGCLACKELDPDDWIANRIALLEYSDESVLPSEVIQIELPFKKYKSGMQCKAVYSQLQNRKVVGTSKKKDFFSFDFSPGVEVSDYINKRVYIVGEGLENDIASTEKFMQLNGLIQSEAVRPRGLSGWLGFTLAIGLVSIVVVFLIRKRFLLVLFLVVLVDQGLGSISLSAEPQEKIAGGKSVDSAVKTRQCGHLVTAAACAYFQIDTDVRILQAVMKPTDVGTSLLQIKQALLLHGLQVRSRKCESMRRLTRLVSPSIVLIVPFVMPNGRGHYGMVVQKEPDSVPLLVDPLIAIASITESRLSAQALSDVNGIVLLVGKASTPARVTIKSPKTVVELGDVIVNHPTSDILDFDINIYNESELPAFIEVRTSCGCVQAKEPAILIDAKGSHSARFFLTRGGWGLGDIKHYVEFMPKNASPCRVYVKGRGIRLASVNHGISLSTEQLLLEASPYTNIASMSFAPAQFKVFGSKESLESLSVVTEWLG